MKRHPGTRRGNAKAGSGGKQAGAGRAGSGGSAGRKVQERTGKSGESGKKRKRRRGKAGKGTGRKSARGRNRNGGAEGKYAEGRGDLRVGNTLRAKKSRNPGKKGKENKFFSFFTMSFGVVMGIAFSANLLTMYLFYELLTLATLPLVMHHMDSKARYAGRVYLTYSMCGAALGFIAMVLMIEHGSWFFQFGGSVVVTADKENTLRLAYILGFFGFGVKAAVFPGHKWLLRASVAPTPVTALLHAVAVVKAGVFAVARITWYGFGPDLLRGSWCQYLAMGAALFTIVYASSKALRTKHLKRRLAWSTISNLSYVLLGIATLTTAGLVAGVVFGCFAVASLGLMGVPPLAGFASKWLLATAAVGLEKWLGYLAAAVLIVSALLTALYLMEIVLLAFFPRQNRQLTVRVPKQARRDPNLRMTLPLTVLSAGSVVLGFGAGSLEQVVSRLLG